MAVKPSLNTPGAGESDSAMPYERSPPPSGAALVEELQELVRPQVQSVCDATRLVRSPTGFRGSTLGDDPWQRRKPVGDRCGDGGAAPQRMGSWNAGNCPVCSMGRHPE